MKILFFSLVICLSHNAYTQINYGNSGKGNAGNDIYNNNVIYRDPGVGNPQINLYLKGNMHSSVIPLILYDSDPGNYTILTRKLSESRHVKNNIHSIRVSNEYGAGNANSMVFRNPNVGGTGIGAKPVSEYKLNLNHTINTKKVAHRF